MSRGRGQRRQPNIDLMYESYYRDVSQQLQHNQHHHQHRHHHQPLPPQQQQQQRYLQQQQRQQNRHQQQHQQQQQHNPQRNARHNQDGLQHQRQQRQQPEQQHQRRQQQHQRQHQGHQAIEVRQRGLDDNNEMWQRAPNVQQMSDAAAAAADGRHALPGDDVIPVFLEGESTEVRCPVCKRQLGQDFSQASFGFVLDKDVDRVLVSGKAERRKMLATFHTMVNTLLNQGGGLVFIHTSQRLLNFWDEQVDDDLMKMVPDDTLFEENFERHLVEGHVIFRVKPRTDRPLSTLDFNSKVSLNKGLADPTHGQMRRLLTRPAPEVDPQEAGGGGEGALDSQTLYNNQPIPFHENHNVQAKVVLPQDLTKKTPKKLTSTGSRLVHFWWHSLKLPHYIAAFAKQRRGGSFYLGVMEEKRVAGTKWKLHPNSQGIFQDVLQAELQLWEDDKNTEDKRIFHLAKENDVPTLETKSGDFTCQGIPLTPGDMEEVEREMGRHVENHILRQPGFGPGQAQNQELVTLHFHPVREADDLTQQPPDSDTEQRAGRHEAETEGACGGKKSSRKKDNSPGPSASGVGGAAGAADCGLYVVEARVSYYHGVCFQDRDGPRAYAFNRRRRPTCTQRVSVKDWVDGAQA